MILGIDPGLENMGWGIINNLQFSIYNFQLVECGVIRTSNKLRMEERLKIIYEELEKIIRQFEIKEMALESLFFARNAKSAIKVAEAIGVIRLCGIKNGLEVAEYTPLQVKMSLVGYGQAEKEQVEVMVRTELGLEVAISPSHAADAVAVALTHGFSMKI